MRGNIYRFDKVFKLHESVVTCVLAGMSCNSCINRQGDGNLRDSARSYVNMDGFYCLQETN